MSIDWGLVVQAAIAGVAAVQNTLERREHRQEIERERERQRWLACLEAASTGACRHGAGRACCPSALVPPPPRKAKET
jgi:hypothetical protein